MSESFCLLSFLLKVFNLDKSKHVLTFWLATTIKVNEDVDVGE